MRMALIEWEDIASTFDPAWTGKEEVTSLQCVPCVTCGLVLHEDDKDVHIVLSTNATCFSQAIVIPKSCIKRMRQLEIAH